MRHTDPSLESNYSHAPHSEAWPLSSYHWQLPNSIRHIFGKFPLKTLPANELPERCPRHEETSTLHIFSSREGASNNAPSFNPACLKWQTFLKCSGFHFRTVAANNHASPTGALPFLSLASSSTSSLRQPIPANKILKCVSPLNSLAERSNDSLYDAYISLIDHRLRNAWLINLYLDERNSRAVAKRLYIDSSSSNTFVRRVLFRHLQQAAEEELRRTCSCISETEAYSEAENALVALSVLLGEDVYFFGNKVPTLFDTSLFAYTHPLLDVKLDWQNHRLADSLRKSYNLVQHRHRLFNYCYTD